MAKRQKPTTAPADDGLKNVSYYRFPEATRKNNPPAKIAAEGSVLICLLFSPCLVRLHRGRDRSTNPLRYRLLACGRRRFDSLQVGSIEPNRYDAALSLSLGQLGSSNLLRLRLGHCS